MQEAHFEFDFLGTVYQGFYIKAVDSAEAVLRKLMEKDCLFGCDTETAGLPQYRGIKTAGLSPHLAQIRLLQIFDGKNSFVFDCFSLPIKMFKEFLETKDFVAHNALFDLGFLRKAGIEPKSFGCSYLATKLLFHVLYPTDEGLRAGLADVTKSLLGTDILKTLQLSDWSVGELTREQVEYAAIDAICVLKIAEKMVKGLKKYDLLNYYQLCKKAQYPISDIQLNGVKVDVEHHREMIAIWRDELYASKKEVLAITGLDDLTDHKLGSWLEKTLDPNTLSIWPRTDPEQGKPKLKTDAHTFADFSYLPIVVPVSKFKKMEKLTSSFGNSLLNHINPATNRIHSGYHICGARTGRLSSSKINMQQMPRDKSVRESFIAEEGNVLVYADLSQIELRVAAELSQDETMLNAYRTGVDLHSLTASRLARKAIDKVSDLDRQYAKSINFGFLFGLGARKFSHYAKKSYGQDVSETDAWEAITVFRETYPDYYAWQMEQASNAEKTNYCITPSGKLRLLAEDNTYGASMNHPVQGGAAEVMLNSLIIVKEDIKATPIKLVNTVHDEIVLECPKVYAEKAGAILTESMIEGYLTVFPNGITRDLAECGVGINWADAKMKENRLHFI